MTVLIAMVIMDVAERRGKGASGVPVGIGTDSSSRSMAR